MIELIFALSLPAWLVIEAILWLRAEPSERKAKAPAVRTNVTASSKVPSLEISFPVAHSSPSRRKAA